MSLESIEKHIQKIGRKRSDLFIQSLQFIVGYQRNFHIYYLVAIFVSLTVIMADITLFFSFESNLFVKISLFFTTVSFLFSLINYLNSLERSAEKMGDIFDNLDFEYKQEAKILSDFFGGKIVEKDVRDFYLSSKIVVDKKYFSNNYEIIWRWINLILIALAVIFMLFNFIE
ncbi:MAG: hypothetical protein WC682_00195 [Parcubacteria group bacterium]|jgi:hypothetical protein